MVIVCVRRHSDSQFSRAIQDAINSICNQKQCPNEERIVRFVQRDFDWKAAEICRELKLAVKDGLLREVVSVSHKGCSKGSEQISYRSNPLDVNANTLSETKSIQTHDWYCFDCQESGEVVLCDYCPKVFHKKCAKTHYISQDEKWMCPSCKVCEEKNSMSGMSKEHVNRLLKFTIERLKDKFNDLKEPVSLEDYPDYHSYICHPVNLNCVETNVTNRRFSSPGQFLEEIKWILHDAIIYFGDGDDFTSQAEELVEDAKQEVEEMLLCPECYFLSNSKPDNWFCQPCNPPHEVVWAKMTGQPPWPAKVLKWNEDKTKALVRFFEARHQRAWVYFRHISPITSKPDVKKRPRQWLDAQKELYLYQQRLRVVTGDVKPKTEPDLSDGDDDTTTSSEESRSCLATVSCQTEEDPNKAVIDKLRRRIDDLEQDLRETKEKLNLQQSATNPSCQKQDGGQGLTLEAKDKVQKFFASLSERFQKNIGKAGITEEKEQSLFYCKLEEVKRKAEEEKAGELEKQKAAMTAKQEKEMTEAREAARLEQERLVGEMKKEAEERRIYEVNQAKEGAQRQYEAELRRMREVSTAEHQRVAREMKMRWEEQRRRDVEEAQANMRRHYDAELIRLRDASKVEHERVVTEMKMKWEEQRRRDLEEANVNLQRRYESELKRIRDASQVEREKIVAELKHEQEMVKREAVREAKRKQWCCNCEQEASYPCCWNTSYCSRHCQLIHWQQHRLHCSRNFVYLNAHTPRNYNTPSQ